MMKTVSHTAEGESNFRLKNGALSVSRFVGNTYGYVHVLAVEVYQDRAGNHSNGFAVEHTCCGHRQTISRGGLKYYMETPVVTCRYCGGVGGAGPVEGKVKPGDIRKAAVALDDLRRRMAEERRNDAAREARVRNAERVRVIAAARAAMRRPEYLPGLFAGGEVQHG